MSTKGEKRWAKMVQELTGRSYCSALNLLRKWKEQGLRWEDECAKLARQTESDVERKSE